MKRRLVALAVFFALVPLLAGAQGFGVIKKKVTLQRKLPPVVHLTQTSVEVKATAGDPRGAQLARLLPELLETALLSSENSLRVQRNAADVVINCTIASFETPPHQVVVRNQIVRKEGKNVTVPVRYFVVTGSLDVAYTVSDKKGKTLDADTVSAKYAREFEQATNQATDQQNPLTTVKTWGNLIRGKKPNPADAPATPPTPTQLQQILLQSAVGTIAPRLVTTDEKVEVFLAQGKLEAANELAEKGLWTRNLELLETMSALPADEDSYRLYNIGVAYEALAYEAPDRPSVRKFLGQAAIHYGKAIDAKPDEKYFLEPQNRIETAATYVARIEAREGPAPTGTAGSNRSVSAAASALTNEKVVDMVKNKVDEETILATIQDAPVVKFDLSADGVIYLTKNGVKGKVLAAMRERNRQMKPTEM